MHAATATETPPHQPGWHQPGHPHAVAVGVVSRWRKRFAELFVFPARVRSSGEFTQAVIHVADVRAAVEEMRGRGVEFEEYDTPETRTENGISRMPGGGEAAWFKDSEGNLVGVVPA
jgi:hypothetical protein